MAINTKMTASAYGPLLKRLRSWKFQPCAMLLYVDLRNMRGLNRILSPQQSDVLIEEIAQRLDTWSGAAGVSGRLWSNEFIAVKAIDHAQAAVEEAETLRAQLTSITYPTDLGPAHIAVSVGLCTTRPGAEWTQIIGEASLACETAKERGYNQICIKGGSTSPQLLSPLNTDLVVNFQKLKARGLLSLHPQPIMAIAQGTPRLAKAEFLVRLLGPKGYVPLPLKTIETLEHFGLATELDSFAAQQVLEWLTQNRPVLSRLDGVSINLSGRSMIDGKFINQLYSDVRNARLPAGKLCFEITETATINHLDVAAEVIALFQDIGCKFSLDDFGSGLCSFGYLQTLAVDEVKIDGRFTRDVARNPISLEIVRAIQQVAKATGKKTVAEFVDAPEKLAVLQNLGVDYGQGWLFAPAMAPEEFIKMLDGGRPAPASVPA